MKTMLILLAAVVLVLARPPDFIRSPNDLWAPYIAPTSVCADATWRSSVGAQQASMRCLINYARAKRGRAALRFDRTLQRTAALKMEQILACGEFSHTPCGQSFKSVFVRSGFGKNASASSVGENLAWGSRSLGDPRAILRAWLNSPEHRENLFNPNWRLQAVAVKRLDSWQGRENVSLWVAHYARLSD
jgi:uncharacterized protein YkwD